MLPNQVDLTWDGLALSHTHTHTHTMCWDEHTVKLWTHRQSTQSKALIRVGWADSVCIVSRALSSSSRECYDGLPQPRVLRWPPTIFQKPNIGPESVHSPFDCLIARSGNRDWWGEQFTFFDVENLKRLCIVFIFFENYFKFALSLHFQNHLKIFRIVINFNWKLWTGYILNRSIQKHDAYKNTTVLRTKIAHLLPSSGCFDSGMIFEKGWKSWEGWTHQQRWQGNHLSDAASQQIFPPLVSLEKLCSNIFWHWHKYILQIGQIHQWDDMLANFPLLSGKCYEFCSPGHLSILLPFGPAAAPLRANQGYELKLEVLLHKHLPTLAWALNHSSVQKQTKTSFLINILLPITQILGSKQI